MLLHKVVAFVKTGLTIFSIINKMFVLIPNHHTVEFQENLLRNFHAQCQCYRLNLVHSKERGDYASAQSDRVHEKRF